jgi:hypothetical protein
MTDLPSYDLQMKAEQERQRLHDSVAELRGKLREKLDMKRNVRQHLGLVCSVVGLASLAAGYAVTGIFVHR